MYDKEDTARRAGRANITEYRRYIMNSISKHQAIAMLQLLKANSGTHMDYMVLWADTSHENKVMYNPHMPAGE